MARGRMFRSHKTPICCLGIGNELYSEQQWREKIGNLGNSFHSACLTGITRDLHMKYSKNQWFVQLQYKTESTACTL